MPTATAASSSKSATKGKARANALCKSTPTGTGRRGRQIGVVKWIIRKYLDLFCIIAVICLSSQNDWKLVSVQHNKGSTNWSADACKSQWSPVLKLPKPTGRSKSHPLHTLALSIDVHINKKNATHVMNDQGEPDLHGELEDKFEFAETEMKCLKLDFNRPPNFNMPIPNEDAVVDEEESGMEVDGGNGDEEDRVEGEEDMEEDAEEVREWVEDDDNGDGDQVIIGASLLMQNKIFKLAYTIGSQDSNAEITCYPPQFRCPATASSCKEQASQRGVSTSKSFEKTPMKPQGTTVDVLPRKQPAVMPKHNTTKSNRCKADDDGELGNKQKASKTVLSKANGLKEQEQKSRSKSKSKSKPKNKDQDGEDKDEVEIINLISDDDTFIKNFIMQKGEQDAMTVSLMDYKRKISRLEQELWKANSKKLQLEVGDHQTQAGA
ncbi:hypothetical protein RSOLAG22IIIB_08732 [Rhizoctonia solani]|uniref:Uncharacterized protein n=1 Tax=Rhizoctonia solani TaxID=456999 RepID=A0A0K6FU39_9AGAM|nr:hypothetical protein RSOLAG22IIIB_08732 [Rhizoctonia solani]